MRPYAVLPALALLIAPLIGCESNTEETAPQCPAASILPDAATFARYSPRGRDLTDLALTGRLETLGGGCAGIQGGHHLKLHAHATMLVTRGPAAVGRTVDVPYLIAVTNNGVPVEEPRHLSARITFPPNTDSVEVRGTEQKFAFALPKGVTPANLHMYVGFQLTPAQLAANRARLDQAPP